MINQRSSLSTLGGDTVTYGANDDIAFSHEMCCFSGSDYLLWQVVSVAGGKCCFIPECFILLGI